MALNLFSKKNKYKGLLSTAKNRNPIPFASTPTGILANTIAGLPRASINLTKNVVKKVASVVKDAREETTQRVKQRATDIIKNPRILVDETKALIPNTKIALDTTGKYTEEQKKAEREKFVNTSAGFTGGEDFIAKNVVPKVTDDLIRYFQKETNPDKIRSLLKTLKAPLESIESLTERLVKSKTPEDVSKAIIDESNIYNLRNEASKYKSAEEFVKVKSPAFSYIEDIKKDPNYKITKAVTGNDESRGIARIFQQRIDDGKVPQNVLDDFYSKTGSVVDMESRTLISPQNGIRASHVDSFFDNPQTTKLTDIYNKAVGSEIDVPFEGTEFPKPQISEEGIRIAPTARQRMIQRGELQPGQPMPKKRMTDVAAPSQYRTPVPGERPVGGRPLSGSVTSTSQMLRGRQSESIESQLQRLRQGPGKGNGESLSNIIQKEVPSVKEKVGILDYLRTPEYVLNRIGLSNEAKLLRRQYEAYLDELPKNIEKITKWSESVPATSNVRIFKYLDGQPVKPRTQGKGTGIMTDSGLAPGELRVAEEIKAWLKEFADRLGLPEDKRISHYITHIFEDDFIKKEFDPELAKLIQGRIPGSVYDPFLEQRLGATGYIEDTWKALDAYVKRATRKIHMDPALEALKEGANKKDISVINYIQRYASRVNLRPTELENLIDTTFKQLFGYKYGLRPVNRVSRSLRQWIYRGTLGLNFGSAFRNLTQGVNTYAELGERWAIKGYFDILTKGAKELEEVGVLRDNFIQDRTISAVGKSIEKMDKGLFYFFELAEKINRGAAYYGGKSRALSRGATPEEAVEAGKELVRKTQFQFGSIDTPVALQDDIAKTISQLQNFTVKQIEYLGGKIGRKEYAGVARYIGGSLVMLFTIGRLFGMKPKDMIPSLRFAAPPTLGIPAELSNVLLKGQDKYGQPYTFKTGAEAIFKKSIPFIPAGVQIKKTLEGLSAVSEGKDTTAGGRMKYKIDQTSGNYLRAALFGKNNLPEAQEYFKKQRKKKSPGKSKSSSSRYNF